MTLRQEVKSKAIELSSSLFFAIQADQDFYEELLHDYTVQIGALKYVSDSFPMETAIILEEKIALYESKWPKVSDEDVDDYVVMLDMLGACYMDIVHP
jgi:hypothetical protein